METNETTTANESEIKTAINGIIEVEASTEQFKSDTTSQEETRANDFEENEIDLFAEITKPTDKDILKDKQKENGENEESVQSESPRIESSNHELTAKLTVAAVSVGFGILLQALSGDWSEEGEKRYTLSKARKDELIEPLQLMLMNSKKTYNPVVVLVVTVLITYIPMTINAVRYRKDKKKIERKKLFSKINENSENTENKEEQEEESEDVKEFNDISKAESVKEKADKVIQDKIKEIKAKIGRRSKKDAEFLFKYDN